MDPDVNLKEQRRLADVILHTPERDIAGCELAEHVQALDQWLTRGGFPPAPWIHAYPLPTEATESDSELTRRQLQARGDDETAGTPQHNRAIPPADGIAGSEAELHALHPIRVTLDAMEPRELLEPAVELGIAVTVHRNGLAVTLDGPRASLYALVAQCWGDETLARETTDYSPPASFGTVGDAIREAADACETLADIDEGEHVDDERLRAIAEKLHAYVAANLASLDEPA